jgi:hypothetical protein
LTAANRNVQNSGCSRDARIFEAIVGVRGSRGHGVSFSFDAYQYFAFVIPGSVLLLGLMFLFPWIREHTGPASGSAFDLAGFGAFVIVSFVLGHLLQGLGRDTILLESIRGAESAYASNSVFKGDSRILAADDREKLFACIKVNFGVTKDDLKLLDPGPVSSSGDTVGIPPKPLVDEVESVPADTLARWRGMVRRIYADVRAQGKAESTQQLQRDYALHLEVTSAFVVLAICVLFLIWCQLMRPRWAKLLQASRTSIGLRVLQLGLLVLCVVVFYRRMDRFDESFARELYLTFINSDACKSLKI